MIYALARLQHGAVARHQLLRRGVSAHAIELRIHDGRLRRVHQGVHLVGPAIGSLAMEAAAVLAGGPTAVVSHRSAARVQRLLPYPADADVWITTRTRTRREHSKLVTTTSTTLDPRDITRHERIPITTPARTILDLAAILDEDELEQTCAEAYARLALIRESDLPDPGTDQRIGPYVVDFVWREGNLVVETDGLAFHTHNRARRKDRARTNGLQLRGFTVLRFTWEDVTRRPYAVLDEISAALRSAR